MIFFSCTSPYLGRNVCGAEEFVLDSYCIREGKFQEELSPDTLQECQDIYEEGEVTLVGEVEISHLPVNGKTRLYDVLAKAKIPADANLYHSYVLRDDKHMPVDFYKLIKLGDMSHNIVMRPNDKIYIAVGSSAQVMVMGEVVCERLVNVPHGYISLREAIALAGGIPFTGDRSYIQVIRGSLECPKVYSLNWDHILCLPNDSLLLIPGDLVYVASKPITEWHRFISQTIPSFGGIERVKKSCPMCP